MRVAWDPDAAPSTPPPSRARRGRAPRRRRHRRRALDGGAQTRAGSREAGTGCWPGPWPAWPTRRRCCCRARPSAIYGDRGDEVLTETSAPGQGFLPELCRAWEAATRPAEEAGIRVAHLRTGLVLAPDGGCSAGMLPLFRFAFGGRLGRGRQYWPWVALDDEVGAIRWLLDHDVPGPVNLTGARPGDQRRVHPGAGRVVHRPAVLPVPPFGPELAPRPGAGPGAAVRVRPGRARRAGGRRLPLPPPRSRLGPRRGRRAAGQRPDRLWSRSRGYFGGMRMPPSMRTVSPFM